MQKLSPEHLHMLRDNSGISDEVIAARGYRTICKASELEALGFSRSQRRVPGLLLPVHATDGSTPLNVYRPDNPRETHSGKTPETYKHHVIKYEFPKGTGMRLDIPPPCLAQVKDPNIPLWITEGQKKADALASQGQCVTDVLGVRGFKGKNEFGASTFQADWDYVALTNNLNDCY